MLLEICKQKALEEDECAPGSVLYFRRSLYIKEVSDALMKHVPLLRNLHRELAFPYFRMAGVKKVRHPGPLGTLGCSASFLTLILQTNPRFGANSVVYMSFDGFRKFLDEVDYGTKVRPVGVVPSWQVMPLAMVLRSLSGTQPTPL